MKRHLEISKMARLVRDKKMKPSINGFITGIPTAKTNKEAYAISYLAFTILTQHGEVVDLDILKKFQNKLKGKETFSNKQISHIFREASQSINGKTKEGETIKKNLKQRSSKNLTKIIAETAFEAISPSGSADIITKTENGFENLLIMITALLGIKFFQNLIKKENSKN